MNKKELLVLSLLRKNSREKLTKLSRLASMPVSTIYDRIKDYETSLIKRHTSIIDFTRLGYGARATMLIKAGAKDSLNAFLLNCKSVNTFLKINNGYDFFAEVIFREVGQMEDFIKKLEIDFGVEHMQVHYIISDVKREDFLSHPDYLKITGAVSNLQS